MQWEELTAGDFQKAVKDTGVCVIAMGVNEKHGEHLPPTFTGIRWYSNYPITMPVTPGPHRKKGPPAARTSDRRPGGISGDGESGSGGGIAAQGVF